MLQHWEITDEHDGKTPPVDNVIAMRILVSAYACEPGEGSEPGVGWNQVRQIARFHDVWVVTRSNNRGVIDKALAKNPMLNVRWVYFDLPRWARFWKKGRRGVHAYYYMWQAGAYFKARRMHRDVKFDLAHHVTFVNYWSPTFLALLPIPFIWGPVGGGESAPPSFKRAFSMRGRIYEALRDFARHAGELDPFVRLAARRAAIALATTHQTEERVRALGSDRVSVLPAIGMSGDEIARFGKISPREVAPFRVLSIGNLLHWKGFEFGLRAFARFHAHFPEGEYWFIGDGPERKRLERLARAMGLKDKVVFWGHVAREQVIEKLKACDLLLFPSLNDSGGCVCLEAMAAGRPVICLDLGGPGLQVTPETGIKVPAIAPEQAVADLTIALEDLARSSSLRARLGEAGRARVDQYFNWERKGEHLASVYERVVKASDVVEQPRRSEAALPRQ
jgi:glycosyltransferase involved in cell wall biosynthesis